MSDESTGATAIEFGGQKLALLPDRAVYWPARETLLVADVHLGKGAAFRIGGVPVPSGATVKDLARLDMLLHETHARRLVVLGDFLHARAALQPEVLDAVARWRELHGELQILLIRGNHDRSAGEVPQEWRIDEVEEPFLGDGLVLSHIPRFEEANPVVCGHVHPIFRMRDFDGSSVGMPCFVAERNCFILPAFGTFTGGERVVIQPDRRIYLVAGGRVIPALR